MSFLKSVAEKIDALVSGGAAFVSENESSINISKLMPAALNELWPVCEGLGWKCQIFDRAEELFDSGGGFNEDFAPYRLVLSKPQPQDGELLVVTSVGFADFLNNRNTACKWRVVRLERKIVTGSRIYLGLEDSHAFVISEKSKSPRVLVKEYGSHRRVPEDIRDWLAEPLVEGHFSDSVALIWINSATEALLLSLPDEVSAEAGDLKFKGPPRLTYSGEEMHAIKASFSSFVNLTEALRWVFSNEREAEMRHVLLATEISRASAEKEGLSSFLGEGLRHALESAQIAYQMAISETGKDTLKALADLRKSITDEISKLSDVTRQLSGSVAAALATGIALIAARIATNAPIVMIICLMSVAAAYVGMTIYSGWQFMRLQQVIRKEWQSRLYRFLPAAEYKKMVVEPTTVAERSFKCAAYIGGAATLILTLSCVLVAFFYVPGELEQSKASPDRSAPMRSQPENSPLPQAAVPASSGIAMPSRESTGPQPQPKTSASGP